MASKPKAPRRIKWRLRRVHDGWLPVVMIGEEPLVMRCQPSKKLAKGAARAMAKVMRNAPVNG